MTFAYSVRGLNYRVGPLPILRDVDLDVAYGELLVLVGPNGAGKSTLLAALCGDVSATADRLDFDGQPLKAWQPKQLARRRSVLLQANQVSFPFTVRQVVEMGRSPWIGESSEQTDSERIDQAIARTDTGHLVQRPFTALSGGERARASLARVLAQDTPVIFLDEPTAALDLRHQEDVMMLGRELAAEGRAIVMVLHDLSLAAAYADRIAIIDGGTIAHLGTPTEVIVPAIVQQVYGIAVHVLTDTPDGRPVVIPQRLSSYGGNH